ncbi:MAG: hypothetical protein IRZ33_10080 [Alicyclobacillaceae bacterium]|nr:hypothetical protein [Alicyclobacillaceae bacterium]
MIDYRNKPAESPFAWCLGCRRLVPVDEWTRVMRTAFKLDRLGLFPYGICQVHLQEQNRFGSSSPATSRTSDAGSQASGYPMGSV